MTSIKLKPHQEKVVGFMKNTDQRGIILYHGLGSGKTITSIAIAELFDKTVVVVVPASMRTQWDKELATMKVNKKNYQVFSYEQINDEKIESVNEKVFIVDEAHRIRSSKTVTSKTLVKLLQDSFKVILLTGTPMVNTPVDMSPLINVIKGENILPMDDKQFNEKFYIQQSKALPAEDKRCRLFSPITCTDNGLMHKDRLCKYHYVKNAKGSLKKKLTTVDLNGSKTLKEWREKQKERINKARAVAKLVEMKPNVSEYSKYVKQMISYYKPEPDLKYFPKVETNTIKVSMSTEQNKLYQAAQKKVNKIDLELLKNGIEVTKKTSAFNAFLNYTRQISNTYSGKTNTPKLLKVLEYIKKYPKPVIVYSNWLENGIEPLDKMLKEDKDKMTHLKFTGSMTDAQKKEVVEKYNSGKLDVLLLSSSGGEGLDLKNTRQIHILEPHWNDAKISQVIGRGIRYKSHEELDTKDRKVNVFHWISTPLNRKDIGTDEYLYQLSEKKLKEMQDFLDTAIKYSIENYTVSGKGFKKIRKRRYKKKSRSKKKRSNNLTLRRMNFMLYE